MLNGKITYQHNLAKYIYEKYMPMKVSGEANTEKQNKMLN